ncbi:GH1 family beta-glucosidase [Tumebacillus flagellatus]|uniref:Beta-glucosidase n=1 Tax=Tumebacillus flagellatus TaxID=1157490 RepID=A0A074LMB2_9BACL|nr:GH1 family beta-glucosidase [Tumebacillus flagellatus]KEO81650.1 beta-glucosidase [Tumebacillus flagellatus]
MTQFPKDFIWGTATAAYQIEGAAHEDGRTRSHWDTFSHTPGNVFDGHTGDVACDHYHRYAEDIALLKSLGVQSYRFSISWPRIFPEKGKLNPAGVAFYHRLLDELEKHGITPAVTMYHWDLPQWIADEGGWTSRNSVEYFEVYAEALFREFGGRVPSWITHNEPWCAAFLSYGIGEHAPGHRDWYEATAAAHHILLSHGKAVELYRSLNLAGQIGITLNLTPAYAASEAPEDAAAAHRQDGFANRWYLDPIFKGSYPADMVELFANFLGRPLDFIQPGDAQIIAAPNDFLGINFYSRNVVRQGNDPLLQLDHVPGGGAVTDMGWEIAPTALFDLLTRIKQEYTSLPLYITENGAAFPDAVEDGKVHDPERIEYLRTHFEQALRFLEEGGNLKGYYVWSFLDNYEWAFGYSKRFGIVYVDYETQARIPKDSAHWLKQVIERNGL